MKKIKISRPNGENWSMENFEIFSAKANFSAKNWKIVQFHHGDTF
jgi:hypothetical protein